MVISNTTKAARRFNPPADQASKTGSFETNIPAIPPKAAKPMMPTLNNPA